MQGQKVNVVRPKPGVVQGRRQMRRDHVHGEVEHRAAVHPGVAELPGIAQGVEDVLGQHGIGRRVAQQRDARLRPGRDDGLELAAVSAKTELHGRRRLVARPQRGAAAVAEHRSHDAVARVPAGGVRVAHEQQRMPRRAGGHQ